MSNEFFELIAERDPFYFRDEKNRFAHYKTYAECYTDMLERLYAQSPKGFLDLVLFCVDSCHMERKLAEDFMTEFYRSGALDKRTMEGRNGLLILNWEEIDNYRLELEGVAKGLHTLTATTFNPSMFNQGFNVFKVNHKLFY